MKRSSLITGAAVGGAAVGFAGVAAAVLAARRARFPLPSGIATTVEHVRAESAPFEQMMMSGVSRAALWGDPDHGPHGAFIRFAPGVRHPEHIHTNDIILVVLKGAYLYMTPENDIRVGAGSFFLIPGGQRHRSGGDDVEGALFYEESPGAFDLRLLE